jgi:hypothetical protein
MVEKLSQWLNQHRVDIATRFADAVKKFTDWITSVDWGTLYDKVNKIADKFGGWGGVLRDLVAIKFAATLASWAGSVASLAASLVAAKAASTALKAAAGGGAAAAAGAGGAAAAGAGAGAAAAGSYMEKGFWGRLFGWRSLGLGLGLYLYPHPANEGEDKQLAIIRKAQHVGKHLQPAPLGIRNNNPLNMLSHGIENRYATPEEGIAAAVSNLRRNYRGLTIAQIADKWTGGARTGNTLEQRRNYVRLLEGGTGLSADQVPNLNDSALVASLIKAQIIAENGQQPYTDAQVMAAVKAGSAAGRSSAAAEKSSGGNANSRSENSAVQDGSFRDAAQATQAHTVATHALIAAIKDLNNNLVPGSHSASGAAAGPGMPTFVHYQMLGAMP